MSVFEYLSLNQSNFSNSYFGLSKKYINKLKCEKEKKKEEANLHTYIYIYGELKNKSFSDIYKSQQW